MSAEFDRARDVPPFANSTEGVTWQANWCDRCLVDAPYRNGLKGATGCPLLLAAICGRTPVEWIAGPRDEYGRYSLANQYTCVNFRAPGGGGGGEPRPKPTPRGQGELFERDGHQRRRALKPLPEDVPAPQMAPVHNVGLPLVQPAKERVHRGGAMGLDRSWSPIRQRGGMDGPA